MSPDGVAGSSVLVIAFLIGFFPDTGLTAIREFVRTTKLVHGAVPSLKEKFPLEKLDGVNIYHRARLLDEGIENLENLAHADLIELMLTTRIPLATLVDWIDQSILYLHTAGADDEQADKDAGVLRSHGIRTATDLEAAHEAAAARNGSAEDEFLGLLGSDRGPSRLRVILDALRDDEWMPHLRRCRLTDPHEAGFLTEQDLAEWDAASTSSTAAQP